MEHVNHPEHYGGDTTYEVIKVLEAWGLDKDFCLGNVIKYIARAGKKAGITDNGLRDLEKAAWYLHRKIERLKIITAAKESLYGGVIGVQALPFCPICNKQLEYDFGELHCENEHTPYKFVT